MSLTKSIKVNSIIHQDCIEGMKRLPDNSIDLVIADPPYNLSKGSHWKWDASKKLEGFGGVWNKVMEDWDNMDFVEYWNFTFSWLSEVKRLLKPSGSIWIFGTYHNIGVVNVILQLLEIEMINEVVWYKRNAFPNLAGRRLTASHETLIWAHTGNGKREYYFNYEYSKKAEYAEDLLKKAGKQMRTVWDIPNNKSSIELKYGKHPTQKPLKIIKRIMKVASKPGDVCLIPFCGAGSDCVAAKSLDRKFIAFETDSQYIEITKERIKHTPKDEKDLFGSEIESNNGNKKIKVSVEDFKKLMEEHDINSISELAKRSNVSKPKIHQYLRGDTPLATTYVRLCEYLEINPNEVLEIE